VLSRKSCVKFRETFASAIVHPRRVSAHSGGTSYRTARPAASVAFRLLGISCVFDARGTVVFRSVHRLAIAASPFSTVSFGAPYHCRVQRWCQSVAFCPTYALVSSFVDQRSHILRDGTFGAKKHVDRDRRTLVDHVWSCRSAWSGETSCDVTQRRSLCVTRKRNVTSRINEGFFSTERHKKNVLPQISR